jgi:hypothetical protein
MQQLSQHHETTINQPFLIFLGQLPAAPSSARVALWRRLRAAGAASLLSGAWVLPRTEQNVTFLAQLAETVRRDGGSAIVLAADVMSPVESESVLARFRSDRGREYAEFDDRSRAFLAEIERETRHRKFTFAELEEIEDDLEKLSAWLDKIRARDFFPSEDSQVATNRLESCRAALTTFAESVYSNEGVALPNGKRDESEAGEL